MLAAIADRVPPTLTLEMVPRFRALPADPSVGGLFDAVAYASRIWACGGVAAHVWPGGFHGFENFAPQAALSLAAAAARDGWLHRLLSDVPPDDSAP